jgi:2-iminobutanoate/2-iminopropanoate deaminase
MKKANKILLSLLIAILLASCDGQSGTKKIINTENAPAAIGPYSQAVQSGDMLFLAGQIALDPKSGEMVEGGIVPQTKQAIENAKAVLSEAGFSLTDVVQVQIYLMDLNDYGVMNEMYASYFKEHKPARAVLQVSRIPRDALIEIMMTAKK